MARGWYKPAIVLMWLVLPTTAMTYWRAWDQLPARMAVHFDVNGRPNGWETREDALQVGLGIMVVMLVVFTVAGLMTHWLKPIAAWPMLILFYVLLGFVWYGNNSIVQWNLQRSAHSALARRNALAG